MNSTKSFY